MAGRGPSWRGWPLLPCAHRSLSCPPISSRSASLVQVNSMLREQLDQASSANQALSEDIRKVTTDWTRSRKELEQREAAWRREEEVRTGVPGGHRSLGLPAWLEGKGHGRVVRTKGSGGEGEGWPTGPRAL